MPNINSDLKTVKTFDLKLTHADVVKMMIDTGLNSGVISDQQVFQLILERSNGSQIILKDMNATDTLVIRFTAVLNNDTTQSFTTVTIG